MQTRWPIEEEEEDAAAGAREEREREREREREGRRRQKREAALKNERKGRKSLCYYSLLPYLTIPHIVAEQPTASTITLYPPPPPSK